MAGCGLDGKVMSAVETFTVFPSESEASAIAQPKKLKPGPRLATMAGVKDTRLSLTDSCEEILL